MTAVPDTRIPSGSVQPAPFPVGHLPVATGSEAGRGRRVVWKFGGTSIGDADRLRAVATRLIAARRQGLQVVAVLSAKGGATDDLVSLAHKVSPKPHPRELDALLAVGESTSCALAAIAIHELGERAVSLTGPQAGIYTDDSHGNARLQRVSPERVVEALEQDMIVLVTGFQGVSANGDITTLGRGGSDASAVALASALGLRECDIFTDVPGVFTADPRVVPGAQKLDSLSHYEMLQLADAGARVLQTRAVELAAAHDIDIHVRSSFTCDAGTRVHRGKPMLEEARVCGVAHLHHDPLYTVTGVSSAAVSAALARRDMAIGSIICCEGEVQFTAPGTTPVRLVAALGAMDAGVAVRDELGSVSVVSMTGGNQPGTITTALSALERSGITVHLVACTPNRVSCHVPATDVDRAAQALHDAFGLHELAGAIATGGVPTAQEKPSHA
ncbi:aspartate kinase [Streptomyces ochraceiscleroticus]|uniref:Aspartokinase n=1 Tax=Streptomyces ochraceiscleroticus TaxID=47761 RepID=A0ABW1MKP5_9ACTN|nr:aspartate kinase [Streptomyces ochraceiscleroticus]